MSGLKLMFRNPVFMREARVRMRGWRAPGLITLYVALLMGAVMLILAAFFVSGGTPQFSPELGAVTYSALSMVQLGLLILAAPGLTAGAISGERERQTLDLLLVTRMSPAQVVIGKLLAAVGFALLLMVASLPVYGILYLFGGVSFYRLGLIAIVYLTTVLLLGSVGLYFSSVFKRTQAAVVAAYSVTIGWIAASPILAAFTYHVFNQGPGDTPPVWGLIFAYLNPVFGLSAAGGEPLIEVTRLFYPILKTEAARAAIWWKFCLWAVAVMAFLLWRTTVRIQPLKKR